MLLISYGNIARSSRTLSLRRCWRTRQRRTLSTSKWRSRSCACSAASRSLHGASNGLPATTEDLFGQVLDRVEGDHTGVFPVAEGLALLAASRSGLSERELLELVGGEVTALAWARVRRSLAPYLVQRGELLDFAHRTLWKAVKAHLWRLSRAPPEAGRLLPHC